MKIPNFLQSYQAKVQKLKKQYGRDEAKALSLVIGGNFEAGGLLEYCLLRQYGLQPEQTLIDIGCGSGRLAVQLKEYLTGSYIGIDLIPELFNYAEKISQRSDWKFYQAPGLTIPEPDSSADFICFFSVLTHLLHEESYKYLEESKRVLKPNGKIIFSFLEFYIPSHWGIFQDNLMDTNPNRVLNQFVSRDAIETWAKHLDLSILEILDGDKPHIDIIDGRTVKWDDGREMVDKGSLGQSVCILTKMNLKQVALENFDETQYLRLNPDISKAVERGEFESGWQHYSMFGVEEDRQGVAKEKKVVEGLSGQNIFLPIPPADLRARVHGAEELSGFLRIGKTVALDLESTVNSLAVEIDNGGCILDFGCGCGRVISWFQDLHSDSKFYGTDIDSEAITWCQEHLSDRGNFQVNEAMPPLPYSDEFFDLVYSISIFTHLPEDMQFAWLKELQRVCKRGAYLLLTVHGANLFPATIESVKSEFEQKGFYYFIENQTVGLPEFYQTSFHTESYIRDRWSSFFEIKKIIPKGIANHQDLVICKNVL